MKIKHKSNGLWTEFKKFITRGNVVDMAVGVAVAGAFTAIVTAFTKGFIAPLLALLSNDASLSDFKWIIRPEVIDPVTEEITTSEIAILWGAFLQAIIDFLIIAAVMFLILKIFAVVSAKAAKVRESAIDALTDRDEKAAEAAAAKAAEEAAAAQAAAEAEAAAQAAAAEEAAQVEALRANIARQTELLEKLVALQSK